MKALCALGIVPLLLLIIQPLSCEVSPKIKVPDYCRSSYEAIKCFERCEEDPEIVKYLEKEDLNVNQTIFEDDDLYTRIIWLERHQKTKGTAYPCRNKCQTEPLYWTCLAECNDKDHTALWEKSCFLGQSPASCPKTSNGNYQLDSPKCQQCLFLATKERFHQSCYIANLPITEDSRSASKPTEPQSLCETLNVCTGNSFEPGPAGNITDVIKECSLNTPENIPEVRMCVNDFVMASQRKCCLSEIIRNATKCREDNYKCDQFCGKILSPRLCQETCALFRNLTVKECTENCSSAYPIPSDLCEHCHTSAYLGTKQCVAACSTANCTRSCLSNGPLDFLTRNCMSPEHILRVAVFAKKNSNYVQFHHVDPSEPEDIWMSMHFTPLECPTNDWEACKEFVAQERTRDEIEVKCQTTPLRTLDILACALDLNQYLPNLHLSTIMETLEGQNCEYGVVHMELFKQMMLYEDQICKTSCAPQNSHTHPAHIVELKCRMESCQSAGQSQYCKPPESDAIIDLMNFSPCRWDIDLSRAEDPYVIQKHYFNELEPIVVNEKLLKHPDTTNVLRKTTVDGKSEYYSFPYFLVVRGVCDDESYYDLGVYELFRSRGGPVIELTYMPRTARHLPNTLFKGFFTSALIGLKRNGNDPLIPKNSASINDSNSLGCPENICYPAFVVPLMYLGIPIFHVDVNEEEEFALLSRNIYVSPFHSRNVSGKVETLGAGLGLPAHAGILFPKERSTFAEDTELLANLDCYDYKDYYVPENENKATCPELELTLDENGVPYDPNPFAPLDTEDILRSQYTEGTSPVQALAGFYDPRFVILGDADMNSFEILNLGHLLKDLEADDTLHSCIQQGFKNRGYEKPIYSLMDRNDISYPVEYYRQRYIARPYHTPPEIIKAGLKDEYAETAIFGAIGLEDRLLLVTMKGLVSYYGHTYATQVANKAMTYSKEETLNKCFKFVRILPKAQQYSDTVVGVTYNYFENTSTSEGIREIFQEIWIGKYILPGKPIDWIQVKSDPQAPLEIVERNIRKHNLGDMDPDDNFQDFPPYKSPGLSYELREANPKSEVEAICYRAFRSEILAHTSPRVKLTIVDEPGWCEAIDATPFPGQESTVQLLVRLRIQHVMSEGETIPVYFYVIAATSMGPGVKDVVWQINSLIPRIPCVHTHREFVAHVLSFDRAYFEKRLEGYRQFHGCHDANEERHPSHIYLNGISYTRAHSNHLFLYGSMLLQSSNQGGSFVYLRSFPYNIITQNDVDSTEDEGNDHRIVRMAFDDGGHYAFLTNKWELWIGSAGAVEQIRLRPSPMWNNVQVGLSKVKHFNDGIPININYDSDGHLYEIVAIVGENGHVSRLMKRPVDDTKLLMVKTLIEKSRSYSAKLAAYRKRKGELTSYLQKPFHYDIQEWTNMCPYLSPSLKQNFSAKFSMMQGIAFPHPEQHIKLGNTHIEQSLMAFQVATFDLVWKTVFQTTVRNYAGMDSDPFREWARAKGKEGRLALARFTQGHTEDRDAILIDPVKFGCLYSRHFKITVRTPASSESTHASVYQYYSLDYLMVAELTFEFSIKNDHQVLFTQFNPSQMNGIELNVENANGSVIQINTEKQIHAEKAAVIYMVQMSVKRTAGLQQQPPGKNILPVAITYHLIGAFGSCTTNEASSVLGDKIATMAMVGCPASWDFVFDWNSTLDSLQFRGDGDHEEGDGTSEDGQTTDRLEHGTGKLCYGEKFVCFFSRSPIVFHFKIFDETNRVFRPYTGKYVMRIVGGGRNRERMRMYTQEEIEAHNIPGISDVSLIWHEWDTVNHHKKDQEYVTLYESGNKEKEVKRDAREVIMDAGNSTIMWACHTLSPCARVSPKLEMEAVFWFKINITNRDVEPNTLCLFEKQFDVMLYGFAPSPELQLMTTLVRVGKGFCCLLLCVLYILYFCVRREHLVWIETKAGVKNWFHRIKESIPKKLCGKAVPVKGEKQSKKSRRLGSRGSSSSTLDSFSTSGISSSVMRVGSSRTANYGYGPSVMDVSLSGPQHLTRRLKSIVQKNREMKNNLLKTARLFAPATKALVDQDFEREFGRTVSLEDVYTPPMPRANKGGMESFI